jgi:hypothetical protein
MVGDRIEIEAGIEAVKQVKRRWRESRARGGRQPGPSRRGSGERRDAGVIGRALMALRHNGAP